MTRVWISIGLFAVIIALAFSEYRLAVGTSDSISEILEKTEISAKQHSDNTEKLCGDMKELWEERKTYLAMFLSHEEIDQISISLDKLVRMSSQKNYENIYVECSTLYNRIESLKETEKVDLHNIL